MPSVPGVIMAFPSISGLAMPHSYVVYPGMGNVLLGFSDGGFLAVERRDAVPLDPGLPVASSREPQNISTSFFFGLKGMLFQLRVLLFWVVTRISGLFLLN